MAGPLPKKTFDELMAELQAHANPVNVEGMARFGITPATPILGISIYTLRAMAKGQRDHDLAQRLWETGIHEARLLACFIDDPALVTPEQMDRWAADFDTWDLCDQATTSLFDLTPHAVAKAVAWCDREEEFVRRGGYALMAGLAWHRMDLPDPVLLDFLPLIEKHADDPRNYVKKAVNWALRNIGKRAPAFREPCLACARRIQATGGRTARWIASDAIRELEKYTYKEKRI